MNNLWQKLKYLYIRHFVEIVMAQAKNSKKKKRKAPAIDFPLLKPIFWAVQRFANTTKKYTDAVMSSKPFYVLTGYAFLRIAAVVSIVATAAITAPAIIALGATSIAVGVIIDTWQTGKLRSINKEHSLLSRHKKSLLSQDLALKSLSKEQRLAIAPLLIKPYNKLEKPSTQKYDTSGKSINSAAWGSALLKHFSNTLKIVLLAGRSSNAVNAAHAASTLFFLNGEKNFQVTRNQLSNEFKKQINRARSEDTTPPYNNLTELKNAVRKQRIQTMAIGGIAKFIREKKGIVSEQEIRSEFKKLKNDIDIREKKIKEYRPVLDNVKYGFSNFVEVHKPFSKYSAKLDKLEKEKHNRIIDQLSRVNSSISEKDHSRIKPHISKKVREVRRELNQSGTKRTSRTRHNSKFVKSKTTVKGVR